MCLHSNVFTQTNYILFDCQFHHAEARGGYDGDKQTLAESVGIKKIH